MSARDELAQVIYESDPWLGLDTKSQPTRPIPWLELDDDDRENFHPQADAIIAAGYRKPRTVTTVEELDALAVGFVVLYRGRAFQHYPAYPAPFDEYQKWKCADGGFVRSTKDGSQILPATVIHEAAE